MILEIDSKLPSDIDIYVRINDFEELLNVDNPSVKFNLEQAGDYEIEFYQKVASNKKFILSFILFLLTFVIQGIIHGLLLNVEADWFKRINPYCLKAKITYKIINDTKIIIMYKKSHYINSKETWTIPELTIIPEVEANIEYLPNQYDFKKQYFSHVRKCVSIYSLSIILFIMLSYSAINQKNIALICLMILLWLGLIFVAYYTLRYEYKRMKELYRSFKKINVK